MEVVSHNRYRRCVAFFITPHGYGHAARAAAVMAAWRRLSPDVHFEIFTRVPAWFFEDTLGSTFVLHNVLTDIGMVQRTALDEDLEETLHQLDRFLAFDPVIIHRLAEYLRSSECRLVVCDIAPLGIAVAHAAGIPSVLIENFTWDYIYEGYLEKDGRFRDPIERMRALYASVDYRIQTEPVCQRAPCQLTTAPVSRMPRTAPSHIRQQLGIPDGARMVLITMGGFSWEYRFLETLGEYPGVFFVVPGASEAWEKMGTTRTMPANLIALPHRSRFFHPDLVNASDAVIGKVGYSTVAEVYWAGVPFGYVSRPHFRESQALVQFIAQEMPGILLDESFDTGDWLVRLPEILTLPRVLRQGQNGAEQAARFLDQLVEW
jgi:UDP:flavonoid glycosyltransferase YjiC (YdhE family)